MHPTRYHPVLMMRAMGVKQLPVHGLEWLRQAGGSRHFRPHRTFRWAIRGIKGRHLFMTMMPNLTMP